MINVNPALQNLSNEDLLAATRDLVRRVGVVEADLLVHIGEIDERKLYLDCAYPSIFAFCIGELGCSEDAAYTRMFVARAARRLPAMIEALRSGRVHLTGLRLLVAVLNPQNVDEVLAQAAGKSKRQIEELVAKLSPKAPVPTVIRKLPNSRGDLQQEQASLTLTPPSEASRPVVHHRPVIAPLSEETYKFQFTGSRALRDKLRQAQELLRHRVPNGDVAAIVERALDVLVEQVKKERFAIGRKARQKANEDASTPASRHIPNAIQRAVYERDEARCTFKDENGRRCPETGGLEFDHLDGFARIPVHDVHRIFLRCRAHNQHAADQMYGRAFMDRRRARRGPPSTCSGTSHPLARTDPAV